MKPGQKVAPWCARGGEGGLPSPRGRCSRRAASASFTGGRAALRPRRDRHRRRASEGGARLRARRGGRDRAARPHGEARLGPSARAGRRRGSDRPARAFASGLESLRHTRCVLPGHARDHLRGGAVIAMLSDRAGASASPGDQSDAMGLRNVVVKTSASTGRTSSRRSAASRRGFRPRRAGDPRRGARGRAGGGEDRGGGLEGPRPAGRASRASSASPPTTPRS